MRQLVVAAVCLALGACASDYSRFYSPAPAATLAQIAPFSGEPTVVASTGNVRSDVDLMFTRGFGPIGISDFNGPVRGVAGAVAQGKTVGAQYVVVSREYANTVQGAIPMTTLVPQTTYSNGTVNAFGSGGYATGTYNGTSTTYSQETSYIPFSVARYDQKAVYFGPLVRAGVGVRTVEISPEDAQRLGTQKGVIVSAVRRGSPAFDADILPGDVLVQVGSQTVFDPEGANTALHGAYGSDPVVTILRNGQTIQKTLHLPPDGIWN
jgi:S1-C subfamily serine protease